MTNAIARGHIYKISDKTTRRVRRDCDLHAGLVSRCNGRAREAARQIYTLEMLAGLAHALCLAALIVYEGFFSITNFYQRGLKKFQNYLYLTVRVYLNNLNSIFVYAENT